MGKIYKPQLRCDAASRLVRQVVREQLGLKEFQVQVREGGRRGMTVTVLLPQADGQSIPRVQEALSPYLFEIEVSML